MNKTEQQNTLMTADIVYDFGSPKIKMTTFLAAEFIFVLVLAWNDLF